MRTLGQAQFWPQGDNFNKLGRGPLEDATTQGLVISDKIFKVFILKIYF